MKELLLSLLNRRYGKHHHLTLKQKMMIKDRGKWPSLCPDFLRYFCIKLDRSFTKNGMILTYRGCSKVDTTLAVLTRHYNENHHLYSTVMWTPQLRPRCLKCPK